MAVLRPSVVASMVVHGVLVALAARLPWVAKTHIERRIEIDVRSTAPLRSTTPPRSTTPAAPVRSRVGAATLRRDLPSLQARVEAAPGARTDALVVLPSAPERRAPVDLRVRELPVVPGGELVVVAPAPRKEWKPRGDAGDPIIGKIEEKAQERFPLERVGRDEYVYRGPQLTARIHSDGSVDFDEKVFRDFNWTSVTIDFGEIAMRVHHEDPYRYEKRLFMDHTAKLRDELKKKRARKSDRLD